jgi:Flp pilus assembly protein TadG
MLCRAHSLFRQLRRLGDKGNAAIEFAIIAPILLALLTGAWDFGNCFVESQRLASAARAGAQYGIQAPANATDFAGMTQAARNNASDADDALTVSASQICTCPGGASVACTGSCVGIPAPQIYVKLVVSEPYTTLFTYPFVTNPIPLSTQVVMRQQ